MGRSSQIPASSSAADDQSLPQLILRLVDASRERWAVLAIALSALLGSLGESMVLIVVTVAGLRLTDEGLVAYEAPLGLPYDELSSENLALLGLLLVAVRAGFFLVNGYLTAGLVTSVPLRWRKRAVSGFHHASFERLLKEPPDHLHTIVQTHAARASNVAGSLASVATAAVSLLVFFLTAVAISPFAALALVVFGAFMMVLLRPASAAIRRLGTRQSAEAKRSAHLLSQSTSAVIEQRVFGVSDQFGAAIEESLTSWSSADRRQNFVRAASLQLFVTLALAIAVVALGAAQELTVGSLSGVGAITLLMLRSIGHGQALQSNAQALSGSAGFLTDLFSAVDSYERAPATSGTTSVSKIESIEVRGVSLSRGSKVVLEDVRFSIEPGEFVGVIGPSGGGKTTLVSFLLGLLPHQDGRYLINGTDFGSLMSDAWNRLTAFIPQDPVLLDRTVRENIQFLRNEMVDSAVEAAAASAHLGREVQAWKDGLDHRVGPGGSALSGGQRQRVCLARALADRPELLVLDEPTSALDADAEAVVSEALAELKGQTTLIVVAHRLSTLSECDRVLMVDDGRVVELDALPEVLT